MRVVRLDGRRIGYALVDGESVVQMDLEEGWNLDLQKGEHEVTIELDPTFEINDETGDLICTMVHLSSKFTIHG